MAVAILHLLFYLPVIKKTAFQLNKFSEHLHFEMTCNFKAILKLFYSYFKAILKPLASVIYNILLDKDEEKT